MSEYMGLVYSEIVQCVKVAQQSLGKGVLPRDVQSRLPYSRAEGSLRRDMATMNCAGLLVRVGGTGARRGYRLPTALERVAWQVNRGVWPHGAEDVQVIH